MTRPESTRVDHYELVQHLADGAQAEVHLAKDLVSGDEVVIKFPHPRVLDNPVLAARWRRQAQLTESLTHPNIQCRLDVGQRHDEPCVVLQYAPGGSLDVWINPDGAGLPISQIVEWGRQLAQALAYLHHLGIVHRDVKPGNILITDNLELKLADFGAATVVAKRRRWLYLPEPPEGTVEYMSPEQITGNSADQRSDIYGWGIVMYELLTGHVPFTGPTPFAAMTAHLNDRPAPLHDRRPDIPAGLEVVVLTALRRQPEHRYQSAVALLEDLDRLDRLDPTTYDLTPEPALSGTIGGSEGAALARFALAIATGFVTVVAVVILLSIALR